jgi:hypothetical protein
MTTKKFTKNTKRYTTSKRAQHEATITRLRQDHPRNGKLGRAFTVQYTSDFSLDTLL